MNINDFKKEAEKNIRATNQFLKESIEELNKIHDMLEFLDSEKYEDSIDNLASVINDLESKIQIMKEKDNINFENNQGQINIANGNSQINANHNIKKYFD